MNQEYQEITHLIQAIAEEQHHIAGELVTSVI